MDQPVEVPVAGEKNGEWWASALEQLGLRCDEDYEWIFGEGWEVKKVRSMNKKGRLAIHLLWVVYVVAKQEYESEHWVFGKPIPPETLANEVLERIRHGRVHR